MKFDRNYVIITLLACLFFVPFLGSVHLFDWDEINFAECAREMLATDSYLRPQINYEPFWEKPPLFLWFQAVSMHFFGVNEFAARFPNAVCGIVTLLTIYYIGKKLYDKRFGWLWVMAYGCSILPHLYFKSGIIDPWFNLFIFLSIAFFIQSEALEKAALRNESNDTQPDIAWRFVVIGGIFSGLAIMTKGPVGYLIASLTWFFKMLIFREWSVRNVKKWVVFSGVAVFVALTWFGVEVIKNGWWFVNEFITYNIRLAKTEDAGHGGFPGYHFVVLLLGCFPASIFALRALFKGYNFYGEKVNFTRWMRVLFWVVLVLFSLVQSKIVHYSSMCYLPLTFLAAITLHEILESRFLFPFMRIMILAIGTIYSVVVIALPFLGQHTDLLKPYFKDPFAVNALNAQAGWTGMESIVGVVFIVAIVAFPLAIRNRGILRGIVHLFLVTAIFVQLVLAFFVGKIEAFSQRAAIDFYESKAQEDCYIKTFGFKSYAHLFYAQKRPQTNPLHSNEDWLLKGAVDKPTYIVGKIQHKTVLDGVETLRFMYEKNGFVFYKRI